MKQKTFSAFMIAVAVMFIGQSRASVLLNEIYVHPPDTDGNNEYVKIMRSDPEDSLSNIWLLEIDGDGSNAGSVDNARNLSRQYDFSTAGNRSNRTTDEITPGAANLNLTC